MSAAVVYPPLAQPAPDPLRAFAGPFEPIRVTLGYRVAMIATVTLVAISLATYVAVIAGFVVSIVALIANWDAHARLRAQAGLLVLTLALLVLTYAFVRPLIAIARRRPRIGVAVSSESEPRLHAFVALIAGLIGVPVPRAIFVSCQINAGASLRSFVRGELELHLGLPLIGTLTCSQLAGIIAHELGHFGQAGAMRTTWLVGHTEFAFGRALSELTRWTEDEPRAWPLRVVLILPRGVLAASTWASRALMRHMERDADRYEIRLAGSDTFLATSTRMAEVNYAATWVRARPDGDPVDQLIARANTLSQTERELAGAFEHVGVTRWDDSHPCTPERRALARAEPAVGVYHCAAPATLLLRDFARLRLAAARDVATR